MVRIEYYEGWQYVSLHNTTTSLRLGAQRNCILYGAVLSQRPWCLLHSCTHVALSASSALWWNCSTTIEYVRTTLAIWNTYTVHSECYVRGLRSVVFCSVSIWPIIALVLFWHSLRHFFTTWPIKQHWRIWVNVITQARYHMIIISVTN